MESKHKFRKELELYLHIPFCVRKCNYCDFLSMPAEEEVRRHYVNCLLEEIRQKGGLCREYQVSTVFFGGGTPSLLAGVQIAELMEAIGNSFSVASDAEITIECNPGTLDRQKLLFYKNAGINRLSIGLQSALDRELHLLGRIHTYGQFLENYDLARKMGFENINVDLISALPGQKTEDWEYTLRKVLELRPEHISAYSLMVEEGTPFYEQYGRDERCREQGGHPCYLPEEETEQEMYRLAGQMMNEKGYRRYEISNYARPGRECRHNIGYWRGISYLGLGIGSASLMERLRFSNIGSMEEYLEHCRGLGKGTLCFGSQSAGEFLGEQSLAGILQNAPELLNAEQVIALDKKQRMEEFMFLGLRMTEGVSRKEFKERFGAELEGVYGTVLQKLCSQGMLEQKEGRISLTEEGIFVSNYILSEFLL